MHTPIAKKFGEKRSRGLACYPSVKRFFAHELARAHGTKVEKTRSHFVPQKQGERRGESCAEFAAKFNYASELSRTISAPGT
jgi:hypothetical protein